MKKERAKTEIEIQMTRLLYTFLLNNEKELGLDTCDNSAFSPSERIYKIACETSTTMYYFLKCKGVLGDEK